MISQSVSEFLKANVPSSIKTSFNVESLNVESFNVEIFNVETVNVDSFLDKKTSKFQHVRTNAGNQKLNNYLLKKIVPKSLIY
jgi:hypothetical protein